MDALANGRIVAPTSREARRGAACPVRRGACRAPAAGKRRTSHVDAIRPPPETRPADQESRRAPPPDKTYGSVARVRARVGRLKAPEIGRMICMQIWPGLQCDPTRLDAIQHNTTQHNASRLDKARDD